MLVEIYPRQLKIIRDFLDKDDLDPHLISACVNDCISYCLEPSPAYIVTNSKKGK